MPPPETASNESTILLVTHSIPSAQAFVARLTSTTPSPPQSHTATDSCASSDPLPLLLWSIKNKYYSANVVFRLLLLSEDDDFPSQDAQSSNLHGIPAVLYLLPSNAAPSSLIPSLLKHILALLTPEISLAVLPRHLTPKLDRDDVPSKSHVEPSDEVLDAYDDLGMELIDEESERLKAEGDREGDKETLLDRSPLSQISETLQTHLWPDLTLNKSQPSSKSTNPSSTARDRSISTSSSTSSSSEPPVHQVTFPTSFPSSPKADSTLPTQPTPRNSSSDDFTPFQSADTSKPSSSSKETPSRSFTDSFNPRASSPSSSSLLDSFPDFDLAPKEGDPMDASDFTSTLASLRALRDEIGKVEDEDERRVLAGKVVEGLFGFEALGGEDDQEEGGQSMGRTRG